MTEAVFLALTGLVLLPLVIFCAECLAALLPLRRSSASLSTRPSTVVLIPAHNEQALLGRTLVSVNEQRQEGDRVLVIADNCTDATADVAREHGAEVIVRDDPTRRGKGYALDFGLRHLESSPPDVVVMVDADCRLEPGAIDALVEQVIRTGRPAQAVYLLSPPDNPSPIDQVSAMAFLIKNRVRPMGLKRLGLPCLLTGSGMAFPWRAIRRVELATGNIVEDMQLGLDLVLSGHAPLLCEPARVSGKLPRARVDSSQRRRWEHGHLRTLLTQVPRLLVGSLRRPSALAVAMELSVPPLSLHALLWTLLLVASTVAAGYGLVSWTSANLLVVGGLITAICLMLVWARFGRAVLPARSLLAVPLYVAVKVPLYLVFLARPQQGWVRTARPHEAPTEDGNAEPAAKAPAPPVSSST